MSYMMFAIRPDGRCFALKYKVMIAEGSKAPVFKGTDQDGNLVNLKDYKGRKLVLYFYPEDDTPTCTIQACNLRDNFSLLKAAGIEVIGVSPNSVEDHKKFEKKFGLPFRLIADPGHKIIDEYGVWGEKLLYGRKYMGLYRTTFLVNEKGIVVKVFRRPRNKAHAEEILKIWEQLKG